MSYVFKEIRMSNRFRDAIEVDGISLYTDSSDFQVGKPKTRQEQKQFWTWKNRKWAWRYAVAVNIQSGDLCWVSKGYPASTAGEPHQPCFFSCTFECLV